MNRSRPRQLCLVTALLGTVAVLAPAAPALAHDRLVSTTPAAGASLQKLPPTMRLTFSAKVMPVGTEVVVKDASGTNLATSSSISGSEVTTRLSPGRAGQHQVAWRVVSQDGHPISGSFTFTTAQGAPAAKTSTTVATTPNVSATTAAPTQDPGGSSSMKPWLISLPIVALAGALILTRRRRTR